MKSSFDAADPATWPVAVLAGGLATRLGPLTRQTPKSLLMVAGEPFIAHQLRCLRRAGLRRVVLLVGHLAEQLRAFVGKGERFGLEVDYCEDGPRLLGTGGALAQALPHLAERFFVMYGDSYLTCDYLAIGRAFASSGGLGLMTVFANRGAYDASNVEFADGRLIAYSKTDRTPRMQHIDYGLSAFSAQAFAGVPTDQPTDLAWLMGQLLDQNLLMGYEVKERFYEIGSEAGLRETDDYLRNKHNVASRAKEAG